MEQGRGDREGEDDKGARKEWQLLTAELGQK